MKKQFEVIVIESKRAGYLVEAETEDEARQKIMAFMTDKYQTFEEFYSLEDIESVEEQK